jgi:hypothetical protein
MIGTSNQSSIGSWDGQWYTFYSNVATVFRFSRFVRISRSWFTSSSCWFLILSSICLAMPNVNHMFLSLVLSMSLSKCFPGPSPKPQFHHKSSRPKSCITQNFDQKSSGPSPTDLNQVGPLPDLGAISPQLVKPGRCELENGWLCNVGPPR